MALQVSNIPAISDTSVEVDFANSDFSTVVDISDAVISVTPAGGERNVTELRAISGDTYPLVGSAAVESYTLEVIYTDGETSDLWEDFNDVKGSTIYFRYSPAGGATNDWEFSSGTSGVKVTQVSKPSITSGDGGMTFTVALYGTLGTVGAAS